MLRSVVSILVMMRHHFVLCHDRLIYSFVVAPLGDEIDADRRNRLLSPIHLNIEQIENRNGAFALICPYLHARMRCCAVPSSVICQVDDGSRGGILMGENGWTGGEGTKA